MQINITKMTAEHAKDVATWTYGGEYALYDNDEVVIDPHHFAFTDESGAFIGYMCFGADARIPADEDGAYCDNYIDVGLHIKPEYTGRGMGAAFMQACLNFARQQYNTNAFRATIAAFNKRAQALCASAGFSVEQEVTHASTGKTFVIVKTATHFSL